MSADTFWRAIEDRPEYASQPSKQFILVEGTQTHSGARWARSGTGVARTRQDGPQGYRDKDICRLCVEHDICRATARVTHWAPYRLPLPALDQVLTETAAERDQLRADKAELVRVLAELISHRTVPLVITEELLEKARFAFAKHWTAS